MNLVKNVILKLSNNMVSFPYLPSRSVSQRTPILCWQNLKKDLFVCLLGGVVLPPKNDVGLFQDSLVKYGVVGGRRRCEGRESKGGVSTKPCNVLGASCVLDYRFSQTTIEILRFGRDPYIVGNLSPCSLRDVFRYVKEKQPFLVPRGPRNVWRWSDVLYIWFDGSSKTLCKTFAREFSTRFTTRIRYMELGPEQVAVSEISRSYGRKQLLKWWCFQSEPRPQRRRLVKKAFIVGATRMHNLIVDLNWLCCGDSQVYGWALGFTLDLVGLIIWVIVNLGILVCITFGGLNQKVDVGSSLLTMDYSVEFGTVGKGGLSMIIYFISSVQIVVDPTFIDDLKCFALEDDGSSSIADDSLGSHLHHL
ncbi:hypothetical protein GQ457_15G010440 [Hibiscus cannabinus]